jgi:hypothetical protein
LRLPPGRDRQEGPLTMEPTVREMLLAKVDELVAKVATLLAEIRTVTEQTRARAGPVLPERSHDGRRDGRRDPAAGPRPPARRAVRRMYPGLLG